jgi:hypothetical protein
VSRINHLYPIDEVASSADNLWIIQDGCSLSRINVKSLTLNKQLRLRGKAEKSVIACESDPYTLWVLIDDKYLHMNEKFIGQLPFEMPNGAKKMLYLDSFILICENRKTVHLFELNEYYNILNHKAFSISEPQEILDSTILEETLYILSQ